MTCSTEVDSDFFECFPSPPPASAFSYAGNAGVFLLFAGLGFILLPLSFYSPALCLYAACRACAAPFFPPCLVGADADFTGSAMYMFFANVFSTRGARDDMILPQSN